MHNAIYVIFAHAQCAHDAFINKFGAPIKKTSDNFLIENETDWPVLMQSSARMVNANAGESIVLLFTGYCSQSTSSQQVNLIKERKLNSY